MMSVSTRTRTTSLILALLLAATLAAAQQVVSEATAKPSTPPPNGPSVFDDNNASAKDAQFNARSPRYKIAPGDSFDLNFELSPEFNQTAVSVQPDGFATLRSVGDVKVQGLTVPELTQTLRTAYGKILNDPIISVNLKDFEKPYFVADGKVGRPGKYDLRGDTTLTQAIAIAGGFSDGSKASQVLLFRRVSDEWMEAKVIDVNKMHKTGNLKEDPLLHPGDMLFVRKTTWSKFERYMPSAQMGTMFKPY
jgi:polysaccharide biosynthesis/export protein